MSRNTTADALKTNWVMSERDTIEIMTIASLFPANLINHMRSNND